MISTAHIRSAFDADLEKIQNLILEMGGLVEAQIADSADALQARDEDRAAEIIQKDKRIVALDHEVDLAVVRVLALRQPIAQDLRTVVTVMKISSDLERIGDYAKNNVKRTSAIASAPPVGSSGATIKRMAQAVQAMLKDALDCYIKKDLDLAHDVRARDEEVDLIYNGLFRELLTHMMEDPRNISCAMHLLFVAKNIERIGDHITSIAEQVIYTVTGELPGEDRTKGADTTYDEFTLPAKD